MSILINNSLKRKNPYNLSLEPSKKQSFSTNYLNLTEKNLETHTLQNPKQSFLTRINDYLDRNPNILENSYLQFDPSHKGEMILEQRGDALRAAVISNNLALVKDLSTLEHTEVKYREALRSAALGRSLDLVNTLLSNRIISDETRGICLLDALVSNCPIEITTSLLNSGEISEEDIEEALAISMDTDICAIITLLRSRKKSPYSKSLATKILHFGAQNDPARITDHLLKQDLSKDDLGKALCEMLQKDVNSDTYQNLTRKILKLKPTQKYLHEAFCIAAEKGHIVALRLLRRKSIPTHYQIKALRNAIYYKNILAYHEITPLFSSLKKKKIFQETVKNAFTELAKKNDYFGDVTDKVSEKDRVDLAIVAASHGKLDAAIYYLENQPESVYIEVATAAFLSGCASVQIFNRYKKLFIPKENVSPISPDTWWGNLFFKNENITENSRIKTLLLFLIFSETNVVFILEKKNINELRNCYNELLDSGQLAIDQVEKLLMNLALSNSLDSSSAKKVALLLKIDPPSDVELGILLRIAASVRNDDFLNILLEYLDQIPLDDIRASFFTAVKNEDLSLIKTLYWSEKIPSEDIVEAKAIVKGHPNTSLIQFFETL